MIERLKRLILAGMLFLFFTSFLSLNAQWAITYGGSEDEEAHSLQQTDDGGYIVAGETRSFGAGWHDIWVLKLSSDGDIEWQKTYGGSGSDKAHYIQQTNDGGYIVAGSGEGDFWILKLSPDGEIEWQKTYGEGWSDYAHSIQQTVDGGYIVAGVTGTGGANSDIWVLKLSPDGEIEWQKTYGGSGWDEAPYIQQTSYGGYIVAGKTSSFGAGGSDIWILQLSSAGDIEWQKTYGGSGSDGASSIQQTSDGGYIVAGYIISWGAGSNDLWILKLSSDGDINPRCSFIRSSNAEVSDTDISPQGGYTMLGYKNITPQDTNIAPQDTNATVYNLCSEKPLLGILTTEGGTTEPAPGTYLHEPGTEVTITATPESPSEFTGWRGDASGETNPITIIMDSDKSIRAMFSEE